MPKTLALGREQVNPRIYVNCYTQHPTHSRGFGTLNPRTNEERYINSLNQNDGLFEEGVGNSVLHKGAKPPCPPFVAQIFGIDIT
jgi:hypothetical protein